MGLSMCLPLPARHDVGVQKNYWQPPKTKVPVSNKSTQVFMLADEMNAARVAARSMEWKERRMWPPDFVGVAQQTDKSCMSKACQTDDKQTEPAGGQTYDFWDWQAEADYLSEGRHCIKLLIILTVFVYMQYYHMLSCFRVICFVFWVWVGHIQGVMLTESEYMELSTAAASAVWLQRQVEQLLLALRLPVHVSLLLHRIKKMLKSHPIMHTTHLSIAAMGGKMKITNFSSNQH